MGDPRGAAGYAPGYCCCGGSAEEPAMGAYAAGAALARVRERSPAAHSAKMNTLPITIPAIAPALSVPTKLMLYLRAPQPRVSLQRATRQQVASLQVKPSAI